MPVQPSINIVGCGRLGRTLSHLWFAKQMLAIAGVYNRSANNSNKAVEFIGQGTACKNLKELPAANFWLIATPDSEIEAIANRLNDLNLVPKEAVVFHCSGSLSSDILQPLKRNGAYIATVHPAHSFGDPQRSLSSFFGTWCAMEGDAEALNQLKLLFEAIGGQTFSLDATQKPLYHAALTVASNYLVTLLDISLAMLEKTGVSREIARELLEPIVVQTAENICAKDTAQSLTGPIARGDIKTVSNHTQLLEARLPQLLSIYKHLGRLTLPIAQKQDKIDIEQLQALKKILGEKID